MSGDNGNPQAASSPYGNPSMTLSQGYSPSSVSPMVMPTQGQISDPSYGASPEAMKAINDMKAMQYSGVFDTPYQKAMKNHPILMGLANGMQAFGQGLTKQPFYTSNQESQASLQNTQQQGMNSMVSLPAQMKMQMMYMHPELFNTPATPATPNISPMNSIMPQAQGSGFDWSKVQGYDSQKGIDYNPARQKIQMNSNGEYRITNK